MGDDMRLPSAIVEHPIESAIAGLLLAALLFVSAGQEPAQTAASAAGQNVTQKM
jgi:hypothetical protein